MRWTEWKFSARLAFQDVFIRWIAIATGLVIVGMGAFFLWRLLPEGWRAGVVTFHYSVYLGIDDVRPWPWVFVFPGAAVVLVVADVLCACSLFRKDAVASRAVMTFGFLSSILWAVGSFFLILVNV